MISRRRANSFSASSSIRPGAAAGHAAEMRSGLGGASARPGRPRSGSVAPRPSHAASVMNGTNGCSIRSDRSRARASTRCAVPRWAGSRRRGLTASRYQSHSSSQKKPYRVEMAAWKWKPPSSSSTARRVCSRRERIQRSSSRISPVELGAGGALQVHQGEPRGVPEFVAEVAAHVEPGRGVAAGRGVLDHRHPHILRLGGHPGQREAQGIRPVRVDDLQRIDAVAEALLHRPAFAVLDHRMDIHITERHVAHVVQAHHDHAGDPQRDDLAGGDEHVRRVKGLEVRRLLGPAQRGERPEGAGEPGVEDIRVAE